MLNTSEFDCLYFILCHSSKGDPVTCGINCANKVPKVLRLKHEPHYISQF